MGSGGWRGAGSVDLEGGFRMLRLNLFSVVSLSGRKSTYLLLNESRCDGVVGGGEAGGPEWISCSVRLASTLLNATRTKININ